MSKPQTMWACITPSGVIMPTLIRNRRANSIAAFDIFTGCEFLWPQARKAGWRCVKVTVQTIKP